MSEQKYEMAQEIQSLRRQVKRLEQDLALESARYQAAIVESARRQAAIDAAEDRDVGIGRYELIRQRNRAEAQRDELLAALKSAHAELIDIKEDVELAKSMKPSQEAFEAAEKLDEAQLLIPFSRERTFEQTKEAARQIIQAAIDEAYEKGRQDEYDEWVGPRKSSPVTEKQVARELLLIPTAQEKLSDGKLRAPVKGNINYPEDAPRHTLD